MDRELLLKLNNISKNFGEIAKNVNISSINRKKNTENALSAIDELIEISNFLLKEIQVISKENISLRSRHSRILNTFNTILLNINRQHDIIKDLKTQKGLTPPDIRLITTNNKALKETLRQGISFLDEIIKASNEIILADNEIISSKKQQLLRIHKLKKSAGSILKDAEKAVQGSKSNFDRGKALSKKLENIKNHYAGRDIPKIKELIDESKKGWKLAINVNNSSQGQFDFAEEVYSYTQKLHESSERIRDAVIEKHRLFIENLAPLMQLAVLIAVDCFDYVTGSENILDELKEKKESSGFYHLHNDLFQLIQIAISEIEEIAGLNLDMTDNIDGNSRLEEKAVQITNREISLNALISSEVEAMTEAARYPVEGSAKNIRNGMEVEKTLKELLKELK